MVSAKLYDDQLLAAELRELKRLHDERASGPAGKEQEKFFEELYEPVGNNDAGRVIYRVLGDEEYKRRRKLWMNWMMNRNPEKQQGGRKFRRKSRNQSRKSKRKSRRRRR